MGIITTQKHGSSSQSFHLPLSDTSQTHAQFYTIAHIHCTSHPRRPSSSFSPTHDRLHLSFTHIPLWHSILTFIYTYLPSYSHTELMRKILTQTQTHIPPISASPLRLSSLTREQTRKSCNSMYYADGTHAVFSPR